MNLLRPASRTMTTATPEQPSVQPEPLLTAARRLRGAAQERLTILRELADERDEMARQAEVEADQARAQLFSAVDAVTVHTLALRLADSSEVERARAMAAALRKLLVDAERNAIEAEGALSKLESEAAAASNYLRRMRDPSIPLSGLLSNNPSLKAAEVARLEGELERLTGSSAA